MQRPLKILGTLLTSGALLSSQILLPPTPVYADKANLCATPGKDGVGAITGIVNSYYPGAANTIVPIGATSIAVGPINTAGSTTPIAAGDLILIIQMQDATINSTDTDAYGNGTGGDVTPPTGVTTAPLSPIGASGATNLNNVGFYEYAVATGPVTAGAIPISSNTTNSYRNQAATTTQGQRTYQVVRVPQYSSGTLSGTTTTSARWNGSSGGIVAFDVVGALTFSGNIDVNGLGFRGGGSNKQGYSGGSRTTYRTTDTGVGTGVDGPKGEGIAGTPRLMSQQPFGQFNVRASTALIDNLVQGYPSGDDGRGAPANAGGGGNEHNAGGGGGANGGNGGLGGRSFNNFGNGGAADYFVGGFGGTALPANPLRLIMGGGGGAGDVNDQIAPSGAGGGGGGMVFVRAGTVSGSGTITARGADGIDSPLGALPDAGGGGGAGGTVLINAGSGSLPLGISIVASGGIGGNLNENGGAELDGPGAGGGAVYSTSGASVNVNGGAAGLIVNNTTGRNNTPNGATDGTSGINQTLTGAAALTTSISGTFCIPQLTVTKTTSTSIVTNTSTGTTATYTITVSNQINRGAANNISISDNLPAGFTYASPGTVTLNGSATRTTTTNPTAGATNPSFGTFSIPGGGSIAITFTVNIASSVANSTYDNPATATYNDPAALTPGATTSSSYNPTTSTAENVTVLTPPNLLLVKRITAINGVDVTGFQDGVNTPGNPNNVGTKAIDDNDPHWPGTPPREQSLRGAINSSTIAPTVNLIPGDEVEYTIYFLNNGASQADNVSICDLVPANQTYIGTGYTSLSTADAGGLASSNYGIAILSANGGTPVKATNAVDGDRGQFYKSSFPSSCTGTTNGNGAVVVNMGSIPNAKGSGTPANSYGFIRFKAKVN